MDKLQTKNEEVYVTKVVGLVTKADGGVCVGGGGLEWRGDGEFELAGVRVDGGGVLGCLGGELERM